VSEFVFRSPKHNDPHEKEVIDHLIVHRGQSIIISQKAQADPLKRSDTRNAQWVLKNIQNALKPIRGVGCESSYRRRGSRGVSNERSVEWRNEYRISSGPRRRLLPAACQRGSSQGPGLPRRSLPEKQGSRPRSWDT
jgi:hypothetical protein